MREDLCQKCGMNSPYITCSCKNVLTYLCIECVSSHLIYSDTICHAFTQVNVSNAFMREKDFLQEKIILFNTKQDLLKYKVRVLKMLTDLQNFRKNVIEKIDKVIEEKGNQLHKAITQIDQINELVDDKLYKANQKDEVYEVFERDQWHEIMDFCPMDIQFNIEPVLQAIEGAIVVKHPSTDSEGENDSEEGKDEVPISISTDTASEIKESPITTAKTSELKESPQYNPSDSYIKSFTRSSSTFQLSDSFIQNSTRSLSSAQLPDSFSHSHFLTSPIGNISQPLNLISIEAITPKDLSPYLFYPVPNSNIISKYDPSDDSLQYLEIKASTLFPNLYSQCTLPSQNLFLCGGWDCSSRLDEAYMITIDNLEIKDLPPMLRPRRNHAVIAYKSSVFVFGGQDGIYGVSSEEFNFESYRWSYIKDLNKVILPGPVTLSIFNDKIFIPSVGFFDPVCKTYTLVDMKVEPGISLSLDEVIYVISNKDRYNNIHLYTQGAEVIDRVSIDTYYSTYLTPLLYNQNFYFVKQSKVYEFNTSKRTITEKVHIKTF